MLYKLHLWNGYKKCISLHSKITNIPEFTYAEDDCVQGAEKGTAGLQSVCAFFKFFFFLILGFSMSFRVKNYPVQITWRGRVMYLIYREYSLIPVVTYNPYVLQMTPGYSATVTLTNTGLASAWDSTYMKISKAVHTNMMLDVAKSYHPPNLKWHLHILQLLLT